MQTTKGQDMKHEKMTAPPKHLTLADVDINGHSVKLTYDIGRKIFQKDFKSTGQYIKDIEAGEI